MMNRITFDGIKEKSFKSISKHINENIKKNNSKFNILIEKFNYDKNPNGGLLENVPITIKDNIFYKNHIASCASNILKNYRAPYSAYVVEKLLGEGAFIVGRTNMDEFAMGSSTEYSIYGPTKNPIDPKFVAGGSSGGAAASIITGIASIALGSDTGGSIRQPAAFCGAVGYKPTYGVFSRRGLVAFSSSLDQIGIIGNNVGDIAKSAAVMNGKDPHDLSSYLDRELKHLAEYDFDSYEGERKIIGVIHDFSDTPISKEIENSYKKLISELNKMNYEVVSIFPPFLEYSLPLYHILANAEAASNLSRYDGLKYGLSNNEGNYFERVKKARTEGFGREVKRRILAGTLITSEGYDIDLYKKAQKLRVLLKKNYDVLFSTVNFVLMPTTPTSPFKLGEKINDPIAMYNNDAFTTIANIIGSCAISLPLGTTSGGLPIGFQLMAAPKEDAELLKFSYKLMKDLG
ncbi:Asp-tRNA(Asn)/Glu-tRNA(Gln) amidotransferase subunit GatA [bacterium]|nr:Asp-tRNA(Asn)/Glu-tRNA(Gln) amidotransferase subunit GatA [bacterium]